MSFIRIVLSHDLNYFREYHFREDHIVSTISTKANLESNKIGNLSPSCPFQKKRLEDKMKHYWALRIKTINRNTE
jgi:hypothetical protein